MLCLLGGSLGAIGVVAWLSGIKRVLTVFPHLPPMMPHSAIALLLLGMAGALVGLGMRRSQRLFVSLAAAVVLFISIVTVVEFVSGTPLFLDHFAARMGPSRLSSPPTAIALGCVAIGMMFFNWKFGNSFRPSHWIFLFAAFIATTALLGYLYGASPNYRVIGTVKDAVPSSSIRLVRFAGDLLIIGVSFSTAVALLFVSVGLYIGSMSTEEIAAVTGRGPGGVLLRRMAPLAALVPVGFGLIASRLPHKPEVPVLLAGFTQANLIPILALFGFTALQLNRQHELLEKAREHSAKLFELASDGIVIADRDAHVIDVNDKACQILGLSREEALTKSIPELIVPEQVERLWETRSRLLKGGTEVAEWTVCRKDGTNLLVEVSTTILPDDRWLGFVRDISERKQAEYEKSLITEGGAVLTNTLELEGTLTNFARLAVRLADICIIDIAGEGDGVLRVCVTGQNPTDVVHVSHGVAPIRSGKIEQSLLVHGAAAKELAAYILGDHSVRNEMLASRSRSAMFVPLLVQENELGVLVLISFRSHRKYDSHDLQLVEAIAQRAALSIEAALLYQTATEATRARDEMLGIVAHDLRNPLQVMLTNARVLRRGQSRSTSEIGGDIEDAATRMNHLIQDLLDVTKIESGRLPLKPEWIAIPKLVEHVLETQGTLASSADLELRATVPAKLPQIWADWDRLNQIFENLIGNAIKFTKPSGHIALSVRLEKNEIVFSIADTGTGIPETELDHVFDRFWQTHKAKHGAGLGLSIVKGLVQAHHGRVWVQSTLGQGSNFCFTIPATAYDQEATISSPA